MSLTLRLVKGIPLTNAELDANFTFLNNEVVGRLRFGDGAPAAGLGTDGDAYQRLDAPFTGLIYKKAAGAWTVVGYGSVGAGDIFSSGDGDVSAVTYDGNNRVATYTRNGTTWTIAYGANGPATETSGALVKTYNYDVNGFFTGISGTGLNVGQRGFGTWANRPANGLNGDQYFATDVGPKGCLMVWSAARWRPVGQLLIGAGNSLNASPLATLSVGSQLLSQSAAAIFPANFLADGMRFRITAYLQRTGVAAAINVNYRVGPNNSNADANCSTVGFTHNGSLTPPEYERQNVDFAVVGTTIQGTAAAQSFAVQTAGVPNEAVGYDFSLAQYLNISVGAITSPDTISLLGYEVEFLG